MATEKKTYTRNNTALSIYLAVLFIAYCVVYLCACPSKQLAMAILAEIAVLAMSITIWKANIFNFAGGLLERLPDKIREFLDAAVSVTQRCKLIVLSILALFATIDFAALGCAALGLDEPSVAIYSTVPSSYWLGFHPAFTLEMLAGALVENKSLDKAEPLYMALLSIRLNVCGPRSDLAGAIYADLGDFYVRKHDLPTAERWYRQTVALGARTGRGYTALATVLREQGQFTESQTCYLKALALRKRVFGTSSKQYNDTLRGYIRLQQLLAIHKPNV